MSAAGASWCPTPPGHLDTSMVLTSLSLPDYSCQPRSCTPLHIASLYLARSDNLCQLTLQHNTHRGSPMLRPRSNVPPYVSYTQPSCPPLYICEYDTRPRGCIACETPPVRKQQVAANFAAHPHCSWTEYIPYQTEGAMDQVRPCTLPTCGVGDILKHMSTQQRVVQRDILKPYVYTIVGGVQRRGRNMGGQA